MPYNIHPIFVHFPIALLIVYSFLKIVPFERWFPRVAWRQIERVLLVTGVLGAFVALSTGETAEHLVRPNRQLVQMHSLFADIATWLYGALLAGEMLSLLNPYLVLKFGANTLTKILIRTEKLIMSRLVSVVLAILGLIAISVTGLLGGALVYGATADPVAPFVLHLLGISI